MFYDANPRLWNRFLESRARHAAPGPLLLRRSGDAFERVHRFEGWMAYRGLVFDFTSNSGRDKPSVVIYGRPSEGSLGRVSQRSSSHTIATLPQAVSRVDAHLVDMGWLRQSVVRSVDEIPWDIHLLHDQEARAAAVTAYLESELR